MSRSHLLSWPPLKEHSVSRRGLLEILQSPYASDGSTRSGVVRFASLRFEGFGDVVLFCSYIEIRAPINSFLLVPGPLSLSLLTSFAYCPVVSDLPGLHIVPLLISCFCEVLVPFCEHIFGYLQDWARAGTFEPSSPIILKPAPKCLRTCFHRETNPRHLQGHYPPGVH
jgi:hypothetical protein